MAIDMPDPWPIAQWPIFRLDRSGQRIARTRGGAPVVADLSEHLWTMQLTTNPVDLARGLVLEAWLDQLQGSNLSFWGYDLRRKWPGAYPRGSWPDDRGGVGHSFDGTCTLDNVGATVRLTRLPAFYHFTPGDYMTFGYAANRALHRIVLPETANAAGVGNVTVEPRVRDGAPANADVRLFKCFTAMHVVPGSFEPQPQGRFLALSFSAMQVLA